jgi:serine/threonine protein kinase
MGKCFSIFKNNNNNQHYTILKTYKLTNNKMVYLSYNKSNNLKYVVKKNKNMSFYNEIYIIKKISKLNNNHIIHFFKNPNINKHSMFFEFCIYGDLYDIYKKKKNISINTSINIFKIIINTLNIVYKKYKISHRDIKLENITLDKNGYIKIIDWGCSGTDKNAFKNVGTINYRAPELIEKKKYVGEYLDVWACGVLFFSMYCGILPMTEKKNCSYKKLIYNNNWKLYWHYIKKHVTIDLSYDFKNIIKEIFNYDIYKRISLNDLDKKTIYYNKLSNNEIKKNLI